MAASSSSLVCPPCSSSSASAISSAPHHRRAQTLRARRTRSKCATSRDLLSPSNASKPCSFCPLSPSSTSTLCSFRPLSPSSTSKLGSFSTLSRFDSRICNNSPLSTSNLCSFCTLSRFDSPNFNNTATRNASSAASSSPRHRKHPNQAGIDVRSGGRSPASSESIPVNCICCSATLSFHRPFPSGRRKCGGIPLREDNSGNCSSTPRVGGGGGGDSATTSRSFSLQNLSYLVPFQSAGRQRSVKVVGVMKAGTSVAPPIVKPSSRLSPGDPLGVDYVDDDPTKTGPERRAGILLHPTSLPGSYGIGELGDEALHFLDWLKGAGCTVWQVLPLVPPGRKSGEDGSPYAGEDANCGNTLLISLEELVKWGLLEKSDLPRRLPVNRVDYDAVAKVKDPLLLKAAQKLLATDGGLRVELEKFRKNPNVSVWLEEAALFAAIDSSIDTQFWWKWPAPLRDRDPKAIETFRKEHKQFIDEFVAQQFLFQRQWQAVHKYAREQGIRIIGDMPIYVGGHSADVWAHRGSFMLDEKTGVPTFVSGVPPDAFSATGQLWGSPLYNWKAMGKDNFSWWAMRMKRAYDLYDEFRIDHFRGLAGYWAVKADEETALNGTWKVGPRLAFFDAIQKAVGKIDIIAEDLGVITSDVVELRRAIKAPGMAVLQFAFGSDPQNPHLPHNHEIEQVVYPGTHDNDTVKGWWVKLPEDEKESVRDYLRLKGNEESISWDFIKATFSSVARTAIIPMQDVLSLDNSARMNIPAVQAGNWGWRVGESGLFTKLDKERDQLRALLKYYNRVPRRIYCPI